jgi:hypothetical protein
VNAAIRRISSHDGVELDDVSVDGEFHIGLRMDIGIPGHDGVDCFDIWICSTSWLELQPKPISGQFLVVVDGFDAPRLENFLRGKVAGISGSTSAEVFLKLSRFAFWEYADMPSLPSRIDDTH